MPMYIPNTVFGDLLLKCQLGKPFDELRSFMKIENLDGIFKKSCFAYFLELSEHRTLRFPMNMVYGLLKRSIKYVGEMIKIQRMAENRWINSRSTTVVCRFFWIERVFHSNGLEMRSSRRISHQGNTLQRVQQILGRIYQPLDIAQKPTVV